MSLVLLDPSGLDLPGGEDEDCLLKLLLQLSDEFFIDGGEEELVASVVDLDQNELLVLLIGVLSSLGDVHTSAELLVLGVEVVDGLDQGTAHLLLKMGESLGMERRLLRICWSWFFRRRRSLFWFRSSWNK